MECAERVRYTQLREASKSGQDHFTDNSNSQTGLATLTGSYFVCSSCVRAITVDSEFDLRARADVLQLDTAESSLQLQRARKHLQCHCIPKMHWTGPCRQQQREQKAQQQ